MKLQSIFGCVLVCVTQLLGCSMGAPSCVAAEVDSINHKNMDKNTDKIKVNTNEENIL